MTNRLRYRSLLLIVAVSMMIVPMPQGAGAQTAGIWIPTGNLSSARYAHTATLLPNGAVLVAGGFNGTSGALASAELYMDLACVVNTLAGSPSASSDRAGSLDPVPFRHLRDQVLADSPAGQHYVRLYQAHSPEIVRLMLADPELRAAIHDGLRLWQTDLGKLADARGGGATISAEQVQAAEVVLDRLVAQGSPELRRAIERERRAHPPRRFVGMPLDRAAEELVPGASRH